MAWTERYVTTTGAGSHNGTSEANAWTLTEAVANAAAGQRINIKAGTYANTTTDQNFAANGTTTAPIWLRGYNTAIGDLDADFTTAKPAITFTTGRLLITGNYYFISNLNISGAQVTNGQVRLGAGGDRYCFDRVRIECTAANSSGAAIYFDGANIVLSRCWIKATSSAPVLNLLGTGTGSYTLLGSAIEGGNNGLVVGSGGSQNIVAAFNSFLSVGGDAIRSVNSNRLWALFNSIYNSASDAIESATTVLDTGVFVGNIIANSGAYGFTNSTGTNTANIFRLFNDFYSNTSGTENGMGDTPSFTEKSESSSPFTSGTDLSLATGANALGVFPGLFENESFTGYGDIGAVQSQATSSGGGSSGGFIIGGN